MPVNQIDQILLKKMFLAGAQNLEANKEWINDLNVFPVPDGDTGTNMTLTILSAVKEVTALTDVTMETLSKAISSGSLRGARGNSGVILSQLLRGFCKEIKTAEQIDIPTLANAFARATETAYKAVMKPKEGTILTVARGISERAAELAVSETDMKSFLEQILEHGDYVLGQTPEMLPVLKQAGVVDSGGQGLMQVLKGAFDGYMGKEITISVETPAPSANTQSVDRENIDTADIKFGYCTEFIILLEKEFSSADEREMKAYLESIGDSIVCVADDDIVKIHVHTNDPGLAIQKALTYGSLTKLKIDNMREEHKETLFRNSGKDRGPDVLEPEEEIPMKPYGFISVSVGEGLNEIFTSLGIDHLIEGGQTMNPSTEDMLNAIEKVHAETIYILPNNKNIILAAEQACKLTKEKKIMVIPSTTVPQGIAAAINFNPESTPEENAENMTREMRRVKSAQVTYAVRNTIIDDKEIHEGDFMGLGDSGILAVGRDMDDIAVETLGCMVDDESELISVYYGAETTEEQAQALAAKLEEKFDSCDVEVHFGGQPVYYYIMSVE